MLVLHSRPENEYDSESSRDYLDQWIAQIAQKNEEAFAELYRRTSPSVYSYALSMLKNNFDAEDVMHDCYIHIYHSAGSYKSSGKPMAWILTITKNLCLQKLREKTRVSDIPDEAWEQVLGPDSNVSVDERLLIEKCMRILTDEERQIIVLHTIAGFKHKEIASHMGLLLPTVLSKYNRAMKKLKLELEKESEVS